MLATASAQVCVPLGHSSLFAHETHTAVTVASTQAERKAQRALTVTFVP